MEKRTTLAKAAQLGSDMYFQDYRPDDTIFDLIHFQMTIAAAYCTILDREFQENKLQKKTEEGFSWVEVSPSWLISEITELQKDSEGFYVDLKNDIFSFDYDILASGVQQVNMIEGGCNGKLRRIAYKDVFTLLQLPVTSYIFYYVKGTNRIRFPKLNCKLEKVEVLYVPAVYGNDGESIVLENKILPVITTQLQIMFGAKNGVIIDKTSNNNPNNTPASEVDPNALK